MIHNLTFNNLIIFNNNNNNIISSPTPSEISNHDIQINSLLELIYYLNKEYINNNITKIRYDELTEHFKLHNYLKTKLII